VDPREQAGEVPAVGPDTPVNFVSNEPSKNAESFRKEIQCRKMFQKHKKYFI
jgi:hypothetical protein